MDYYKRYMGDYQRDTGELSLIQHGAYTVLLDHYYSVRKPLPPAMQKLYRLCRATTKMEQEAVESIADEFFPLSTDGLRHNERADEEIAKWEVFAEENREKGKLGGRPKKNPNGNPSGNPAGSNGDNPEVTHRETRRETQGLQKPPVLETRAKPYPDPNPNPKPDPIRSHAISEAREARRDAQGVTGSELSLPSETNARKPDSRAQQPADLQSMARVKDAYPKFAGNQADWQLAERHCLRQLEEGATWEQLEDAARRFAAFVNSGGRSEPKYVDLPSKFFGNGLWAQTWGPVATKAEARLAKNLDAGAEAKRQLFGDNHVGK